jgi:hypothetical protein
MPKCFGCSNSEPFERETEMRGGESADLHQQRCQVCSLRYLACEVDEQGTTWSYWVPITATEADDLDGTCTITDLLDLMASRTYWVQEGGNEVVRAQDGALCEALSRGDK